MKRRKKKNKTKLCETEVKLIEGESRYYLNTDDEELNRETNNNKINQKNYQRKKNAKKCISSEFNNEKVHIKKLLKSF